MGLLVDEDIVMGEFVIKYTGNVFFQRSKKQIRHEV
jgi:hypothetical protein